MAAVLGISCFYHDAAAALLVDGVPVAAAEEERFSRRKHDNSFPEKAIAYCLREASLEVGDLDHLVFYEKPLVKFDRLLTTILATWPRSLGVFIRGFLSALSEKIRIRAIIQKRLATDADVLYCQHHLAHAASAFLVSPFDEAAIITADGVGEWATTTWGVGRGTDIKMHQEMRFPHSIGLLFSAVTAYLGFRVNDAEWKVMGLASYGTPRFMRQFQEIVDVREDGSIRLNMRYFSFPYSTSRAFNRNFEALFGRPGRSTHQPLDEFHADIAASSQRILEDIMVRMGRYVRAQTGMPNVCLAGGVALNCVANWRVLRESGFRHIFIQPAAGDSGAAMGAALYLENCVLNRPRRYVMTDALLGPSFDDKQIEQELLNQGAQYLRCDSDEQLVERTADLLAQGKVVAWFQGRMEYGPRALGARSLLADPRDPNMKDLINSKVKFRESFRPFAPAVIHEHVAEYFDVPPGADLPFMLLTPPVRAEKRGVIPAVTHADGSARVQTVHRDTAPLFHALIQAFAARTGVPVLVNTSFNVRGEPIVCTPKDAYNTFIATGIDALVIGNFILTHKRTDVRLEGGFERSDALEALPLGRI